MMDSMVRLYFVRGTRYEMVVRNCDWDWDIQCVSLERRIPGQLTRKREPWQVGIYLASSKGE
jgi:hypothetical protein